MFNSYSDSWSVREKKAYEDADSGKFPKEAATAIYVLQEQLRHVRILLDIRDEHLKENERAFVDLMNAASEPTEERWVVLFTNPDTVVYAGKTRSATFNMSKDSYSIQLVDLHEDGSMAWYYGNHTDKDMAQAICACWMRFHQRSMMKVTGQSKTGASSVETLARYHIYPHDSQPTDATISDSDG